MQILGPPLNGKYSCSLLDQAENLICVFIFRATYPAWPQRLPSLWLEFFGIGAIEFWSSVHGVQRPLHCLPSGDEEGRLAVLAAAAWEDGIHFGAASVAGDYRVET